MLALSCLSDVMTKVLCLDAGAQDYLTKPFSLDELLARVRVQLRADHAEHDGTDHSAAGDVIKAGQLILDLGRMQANAGLGPVALTRLEMMLLRELIEHSGESVTKGTLLASVWGIDFDPGSNVVDVCVRRLDRSSASTSSRRCVVPDTDWPPSPPDARALPRLIPRARPALLRPALLRSALLRPALLQSALLRSGRELAAAAACGRGPAGRTCCGWCCGYSG